MRRAIVATILGWFSHACGPRARNTVRSSDNPAGETSEEIRRRLAEEKACLEKLDAERNRRGDSSYGKTTENRIVWGELLELELQDVDDQIRRICRETGDLPAKRRAS